MNELLSTAEVAARLGVTMRRVQALAASGRIKATKIGKTLVFTETDVKAFKPRPPGKPGHNGKAR